MSIELRIILLVGAILTMIYFLHQIRKNRMQIEYAISWSLFSAGLLILGIFPGIVIWASRIVGVESPANMLYLCIIFLLILKQFSTTVKLSKMNQQITVLTQSMALEHADREKRLAEDIHTNNGGVKQQHI